MLTPVQPAVIDGSAAASTSDAIRVLVHKRFPQNVLLEDLRADGENRFVCSGRIPTNHPLFNEGLRTPRQDILFYTEVGRQASLAITHAFLHVSLEDVFVFERSEAAVTERIWRLPVSADAVEIEVTIRETVRRRNSAVSRVVADHRMSVGGEHVFTGTGTWTVQPAALFQRLRRMSGDGTASETTAPVVDAGWSEAPEWTSASNVVISPLDCPGDGAAAATLIVDRTHPYFFDHPCDHVPGMLMLEGCAQLAAACAGSGVAAGRPAALMSYDINFTQFVECALPTTLTLRVGERNGGLNAPIDIVVSQRNVAAGTARLRLALPG